MPDAKDPSAEILEELRHIRELLESSTNDGTPLKAMTPSPEFIAAMCMVMALMTRDKLDLHPEEVAQRVQNGIQLSAFVIKEWDAANRYLQRAHLNALMQEGAAGE